MKPQVRLETWIYLLTVVLLATFQMLFFFVVSRDHYLGISLLCLATDLVLALLFRWTQRSHQKLLANRFGEVRNALQVVLDLTRTQHGNWVRMLEGVAALEADDMLSLLSLQETVDSLDRSSSAVINRDPKSHDTVETLIDSIQTIILLNHGLMADLDKVLNFYEATYTRFQDVRKRNDLNHFRLDEAVSLLTNLGNASSGYSEKLVLEVVESFREINAFSEQIGTKVSGTMHRLMDGTQTESLGSINRESTLVSQTMDRFFQNLEKTIQFSQNSVNENLAQIDRVKVMAEAISDFSESIRMISLNLNIEAARVTGHSSASGRGFQVLAVKLSEFALKAQNLAKQQTDIIATASSVIADTGSQEMDLLHSLQRQIPGIKGHLDPFAAIIGQTYQKFEGVETQMSSLTAAIDEKLKAVIGKLQFQDLVRQEHEHVLQMFSYVRDLATESGLEERPLEAEVQRDVLKALLHHFERMASTNNELLVVREFRRAHGQLDEEGTREDRDDRFQAGSVNLF